MQQNINISVEKEIKRQKITKIIKNIFIYIFLAIVAVYIVFPFYWMNCEG